MGDRHGEQLCCYHTAAPIDKPVVVDGEIVIRQIMHISVTFDHRALDGVPVAEFIHTLKSNLEDPKWLKERCVNNQLPSRRN